MRTGISPWLIIYWEGWIGWAILNDELNEWYLIRMIQFIKYWKGCNEQWTNNYHSLLFGIHTPTLSPFFKPSSNKPRAKESTLSWWIVIHSNEMEKRITDWSGHGMRGVVVVIINSSSYSTNDRNSSSYRMHLRLILSKSILLLDGSLSKPKFPIMQQEKKLFRCAEGDLERNRS